jgi:acid phosphatase type 7
MPRINVRKEFLMFLRLALLLIALTTSGRTQEAPVATPKNSVHRGTKGKPKVEPAAAILVGAGDIAGCADLSGAEATAKLIDKIPGTVFAAGDLAYEKGSAEEFQNCYGKTWGRFKDRTRPALGNHEYRAGDATPYFQYWGATAGKPGEGYYSYELGSWHIIVLNTNCTATGLGGCGKDSREEIWLRQDLAAHRNVCTLAYSHQTMFSSGLFAGHAMHPELQEFWRDLYAAHADLILAGHEHSYERFAPQDPDGRLDKVNGIREIVAGTGGRSHTMLGIPRPNSEVRNDNTYGVLKMTLAAHSYKWEFISEAGKSFRDSGEDICHNQPPPAAAKVSKQIPK